MQRLQVSGAVRRKGLSSVRVGEYVKIKIGHSR